MNPDNIGLQLKGYSVILQIWHESKDINKKQLISKISVDSDLYVYNLHTIVFVSLLYRLLFITVDENFLWKLLSFHTDMISA